MHSTYKKGDLFLMVNHPESGFRDGSVAKMQDVERTLLKLVSGECEFNNARNNKPGAFATESSLIPITPAIADLLNAINNGDREAARKAVAALAGPAESAPAAPAFEAEAEASPAFEVGDWVECISLDDTGSGKLLGIKIGEVRQVDMANGEEINTGGGSWGSESNYRLIAKHDDRAHWRNWKEGDFVRVLCDTPWWKAGGRHEIRNVNGKLGVYDLDGTFRPLPLTIVHKLVQP